jgi:hypothetical protein
VEHLNNQWIGNQEFLGQINLSTVLTYSRQSALISQAARVEIINLIRAVVTRLVREARFQALHARPWILLQRDPDAGYILSGDSEVSSGLLLSASTMSWSHVPVKQSLEKEFKIPIYVNNKPKRSRPSAGFNRARR